MVNMFIEMAIVSRCELRSCAYNADRNCHAKAITVGGNEIPVCDTYLEVNSSSRETKRIAGVGACKVSSCQFNDDFECMADSISVGFVEFFNDKINCLTYSPKQ